MLLLLILISGIDNFIIGSSLKNQKISVKILMQCFLYTFLLFLFFLLFYHLFSLKIENKLTKTILYLYLAITTKNEPLLKKKLFIICLTNSLDGILLSLLFTNYPIVLISFLFSFTSILMLYIGNKAFKNKKVKKNIGRILYLFLAFISLF